MNSKENHFLHLEKKLQKNQILYAVSFFLTLPLGCVSCLLVRATPNKHSIKCFPTITWVKQAFFKKLLKQLTSINEASQ